MTNCGAISFPLIQEWSRGNEWKYFIRYLAHTEEDKLHFEVRWSIPTRRKPIPRATASVYFTLWIHNQVLSSFVALIIFYHRMSK